MTATTVDAEARGPLLLLGLTSAVLLAVRLYAASHVGFGDSEALYACYALHPQPAYLDHPGLIGLIARAIGGGTAPGPEAAHRITAIAATLVPWIVALAARATGATWRSSLIAALATAAAPEIGFGLVAMTPDLPLAIAWLGALGLAALGLRAPESSGRAAAALLFAGMLAGVACAAKVSGALLALALVATYTTRPARAHARTVWPWAGLAAGLLIVVPIAQYEARAGLPMLRHRLIATQAGAGLSLHSLGVVFGQLLYVSPVLLVAAALAARDLLRSKPGLDPVTPLLTAAFLVPLVPLLALALWSPVSEPHWIAPALLALPLHAARARGIFGRRLVVSSIATGMALLGAVYVWILVPGTARLRPESADPRLDIANELFGWPRAVDAVRQIVDQARLEDPADVPVVIGPSWTICAQLHAAIDQDIAVGCDGPIRDDFSTWLPRAAWEQADQLLFVTDGRYPVDLDARFPHRFAAREWSVPFARGGRLVRTFKVTLLLPRAIGQLHSAGTEAGAIARSPASRISARSSSSSGFGVVRSFSP
jgi:hypothetical protein